MNISPLHIDDLKKIAGNKAWIDDPKDMPSYLIEPREKYQGTTPLILLPDSTEKVAKIVSYCAKNKIPLVPQGGNTGLVGGSVPTSSGNEILISLKRLNKIREMDIPNQTITVDAGCILSDVHQIAKSENYLFPLSLASEGSCMIGGNISTNAGGVNVLRYGNMRSFVLGLEVILPNGDIWHGLRGLQKDNTGYDLKQIFIGAEGTLGIITAATLKLFPYPHEKQTAFVAVPDPEAAISLLTLTRHICGDCITAFEIMPRLGIDIVTKHITGLRDPLEEKYDWYILLECSTSLSGDLLDLDKIIETILSEAMEKGLVLDGVIAKNQTESENLWHLREYLSEAQKHEGGSIKHDISVPVSRIAEFFKKAEKLVEDFIPHARPVPFGHLGDGNIHYNISQPPEMSKQDFLNKWKSLNKIIHDLVNDFQGSFSAEHGIGHMKTDDMLRYKSPVEIDMMKRLKTIMDPDGILNPNVILKK